MTNRNELAIASSQGQSATHHRNSHLLERFSFQPYSEVANADTARGRTSRRALLDKRLLEDVYEQIALQPGLDTRDLVLRAYDGVVSIEGSTSDRAMRARIGNFIRRCCVVKQVINRMQIRSAQDGELRSTSARDAGSTPRFGTGAIAA